MRIYQRILLVVVLAILLIAAGVSWERFCMAPLVEQYLRKADPPNSDTEVLPTACLEELSAMGAPETDMGLGSERRPANTNAAAGELSSPVDLNVTRSSGGANQVTTHIQVADRSSAIAIEGYVGPPIHDAQSAEWVEPAPRGARPVSGGAMKASAEESIRADEARDRLKSVDVLDLMRRLQQADDNAQQAEARRELVRRGFSEVDLELARQLFSPDTESRKQLARAVPRLSSVDAAKWLMWLAQDPQPEVRLAAVSTLATTGDPSLLDRVEALARSDRDPQVQALADQIAKQRDLSSTRGDSREPAGAASFMR